MKDYVENVVMVHDVLWAEGWGFESQSNRMLVSSFSFIFFVLLYYHLHVDLSSLRFFCFCLGFFWGFFFCQFLTFNSKWLNI